MIKVQATSIVFQIIAISEEELKKGGGVGAGRGHHICKYIFLKEKYLCSPMYSGGHTVSYIYIYIFILYIYLVFTQCSH